MSETIHAGGCLCGAVRYEATGEPLRVGLCHCNTCKRETGAALPAFVVYPRGRVALSGAETGAWRTSEAIERHFCRTCGSPVFALEGEEINLSLGTLDAPERFRPSYELWAVRRLPWLPPIPGLTSHAYNRSA